MLELLRIRDLALIEDIELEFGPGMNVLTGETGAGKSFIVRALQFLIGEKLGTDLVRPSKEKAVVEALFVLGEGECVLRRELSAESGRSRVYVNDRLCSQEVVREMRERLLLHTSQHGQQKLLQPAFQMKILDDAMGREDLLLEKERLVRLLHDCAARLEKLEGARLALEEKRDMLEYQQAEIDRVAPKAGEEEELEARRLAMRNQAGIAENAADGLRALHGGGEEGAGLMRSLSGLERAVEALAGMLEEFSDMPDRLADTRALLRDMDAALLRAARSATETADMDAIESRLYALAQLRRKLKRPLEAIVSLRQEIGENLDFLDRCTLERAALKDEEQALCDRLCALLAELNPARQAAAAALSLALRDELANLGFSEHIRVLFEFSEHTLYPACVELRARLLWQPNPGQPPQPLERIASGGELSRFLLAVVTLMSRAGDETPTLIFDEVDAGVGGLTLNRVAASLSRLAEERQMLLITHWPQLAGRATRHFVVTKEIAGGQTYTRCERLAPRAIGEELLRMSGGRGAGGA